MSLVLRRKMVGVITANTERSAGGCYKVKKEAGYIGSWSADTEAIRAILMKSFIYKREELLVHWEHGTRWTWYKARGNKRQDGHRTTRTWYNSFIDSNRPRGLKPKISVREKPSKGIEISTHTPLERHYIIVIFCYELLHFTLLQVYRAKYRLQLRVCNTVWRDLWHLSEHSWECSANLGHREMMGESEISRAWFNGNMGQGEHGTTST